MMKGKFMPEVKPLKYDTFHTTSNIIFQLINKGKKVLDIGCATGRLAEKLRKKECLVVGIEIDKQLADAAQQRCDKVIMADVEELKEVPFSTGYFDVIVFADILEHLKNPEAVLTNFRKYLSDDGLLIVSIPNVANWTSRLKLLLGRWNYKEYGLLDRTHLRFFTFKTARKLIESSGYKIIDVLCTSGHSYIDRKMGLKNPANIWKSLLAYQFVIKAVKQLQLS